MNQGLDIIILAKSEPYLEICYYLRSRGWLLFLSLKTSNIG